MFISLDGQPADILKFVNRLVKYDAKNSNNKRKEISGEAYDHELC